MIEFKHRNRAYTATLEDVERHGHKTKGGLLKWKDGMYNESLRFYFKKEGNEKKVVVRFEPTSMKASVQSELENKLYGLLIDEVNESELWVLK